MANNIKLLFDQGPEGLLQSANYETKVSYTGKGMAPYELFLGGYVSCLHATFMGIMKKRKLVFENIVYDVTSHKREEVPTIMAKLITNIVITGAEEKKHKSIIKSMTQAEHYCSISYMINHLGTEMVSNIEFK